MIYFSTQKNIIRPYKGVEWYSCSFKQKSKPFKILFCTPLATSKGNEQTQQCSATLLCPREIPEVYTGTVGVNKNGDIFVPFRSILSEWRPFRAVHRSVSVRTCD